MTNHFNIAYLLLGGNMGNRIEFLNRSKELIKAHVGMIVKSSPIYETASWGNTDLPPHLNQAILIATKMDSIALLNALQDIETVLGRERKDKWEARKIDIDIIFFNEEVTNSQRLIVPHPFLQDRKFVLIPLNAIAPNYHHPILNKTVSQLLEECQDPLPVALYEH